MVRKSRIRQIPLEALAWSGGLLFLALSDPESALTICPLHNLGFEFCPGCGLGSAVSHIFRGEWSAAWSAHPLGFVALPLLAFRIISLFQKFFIPNNTHHGKRIRPAA